MQEEGREGCREWVGALVWEEDFGGHVRVGWSGGETRQHKGKDTLGDGMCE